MRASEPDGPVVLAEYGETTLQLTQGALHRLRRLTRNRLTVLPGESPNRWVVKASSYVGTVVTPDVQILIKPKVNTTNLFYLLEAGGRTVPLSPAVFEYERTSNLVPAFATFFAQHLEAALARGIPREYREQQERLTGIRGRVDLHAQLRLSGLVVPTECRFDEYSADTQLNRLLLGALTRLRRLPGVTVSTRQALHTLAARLEEAGPLRAVDLRSPTRFTRLNEHCRSAEQLARIVLADASLLDAAGETAAATFLLDMNRLFEDFVEARLRRYLRDSLDVIGQEHTALDTAGHVRMRPDLTFRRDGRAVYVADSKYKVTADGFGRESDYYQILAYTSALDLHEGLLVYCQHDGAAPPQEVEVRHAAKQLRSHAIRLDRTPADVELELQALAATVASRAKRPGSHPADAKRRAGSGKESAGAGHGARTVRDTAGPGVL